MAVNGLAIFNLTEKEALKFVKKFEKIREERGDYGTMNFLFYEALDNPFYYKNILLNAWRALTEMSTNLKEIEKEIE